MVLVTTPPQPASNARMMLLSDSVGGAEESRNGFGKLIPVKFTDRLAIRCSVRRRGGSSAHPVGAGLAIPLGGHLLGLGPELDRPAARDVAHAEARVMPAAERERLARHRHTDVDAHHPGAGALHHLAGD